MPQIRIFRDLKDPALVMASLREIFFLTSSRREFSSEAACEEFFQTWTRYYLNKLPQYTYLAFDGDERLLGYLTGCPDSFLASKELNISSLNLYSDLIAKYPAHLHINCHPSAQGRGVGSALMQAFIQDLVGTGARGVHVVTSPSASNVAFYSKAGFDFTSERTLNNTPVLFMGKRLAKALDKMSN